MHSIAAGLEAYNVHVVCKRVMLSRPGQQLVGIGPGGTNFLRVMSVGYLVKDAISKIEGARVPEEGDFLIASKAFTMEIPFTDDEDQEYSRTNKRIKPDELQFVHHNDIFAVLPRSKAPPEWIVQEDNLLDGMVNDSPHDMPTPRAHSVTP